MALYPLHKYFVFNHEIRPNQLFVPSENEGGIYEVLRVSHGVPLFLEDHLERFYRSAKIAERSIRFSNLQIETLLKELIQKNGVSEGNILLSYKVNLKAFFIHHNYPSEEMYKTGVRCGLLKAERDQPNAKVFQTPVRIQAVKMLEEDGFYEVLLLN
ncbi:MAG TPA: aminotransferase class IV, partial [Draconibacterium sp.]|nr:aminotransferase class IV [Draconibacterium sp.]